MKNILIFISFLFSLFILRPAEAIEARIEALPSSGNFIQNQEFEVSVRVVPKEGKVDTIQGKIFLKNLSCQELILEQDIISASFESPFSCRNLDFLLGIPQGTDQPKVLFKIKVKGESEGEANISFGISKILSEGNEVKSSQSPGNYKITSLCSCSPWGEWEIGECNQGGCLEKRAKIRTRKCNPRGCEIESEVECIEDPLCKPKNEPKIVIEPPFGISGFFSPEKNIVQISWKPSPTKEISGYFILRKLDSEIYYKLIGTVTKNTLSFEDKNIEMGKTYDYTVVAFQGRSWNSSFKSGFPPKIKIKAEREPEKKETEEKKEINENQIEIVLGKFGKINENFLWRLKERDFEIEILKGTQFFQNGNSLEEKAIYFSVKPLDDWELKKILSSELEKDFIKGTGYLIEGEKITSSQPIKIKIGFKENPRIKRVLGKVFDGKNWKNLKTDLKDNFAIIETSHFSVFALFKKEIKQIKPFFVSKEDLKMPPSFFGAIGFALISILGLIFWYFWQKNNLKKNIERKQEPDIIDLRKFKL